MKPVRPALGLAPRPVAPSSRISPPEPVEAPENGAMAVGWLCVSTFIRMCTGSCTAPYWRVSGFGKKRPATLPTITEALSLYADSTPSLCIW
ncbi:hypothetical protein D9M71_642800 [compost metagenome]